MAGRNREDSMSTTKIPDGFTPWNESGTNPVPGKTVTVMFPDGDLVKGPSEGFYWHWLCGGISGGDIRAYRVEEASHGG